MKTLILSVTVAILSISTPAFAGHYNLQIWEFVTDNCDQVTTGEWCESVTVEVSTSTWCGSSCSWAEKTDTFNKAMAALVSYWFNGLSHQGFRGMNTPNCPSTYLYCQSVYADGYRSGERSVGNLNDWSAKSRADYIRETSRYGFFKQ